MKFKEFVKKYLNKSVDYDKAYSFQCMDLFNQYLKEVYGIENPIKEFPVASAYQLYDKAKNKTNFVCQLNGPNDVPQEGDIIIWNQGVGPHGHVGLYVSGDVMNLKVFEQNWNNVQKCVINDHKYNHIHGWFRLKK